MYSFGSFNLLIANALNSAKTIAAVVSDMNGNLISFMNRKFL